MGGSILEIRVWRQRKYKAARTRMHGMLSVHLCPRHCVHLQAVPLPSPRHLWLSVDRWRVAREGADELLRYGAPVGFCIL
jgi:hypothetical protein